MENKVLALIASFIAMVFVVFAYFVKKKERYLLFQLLCIVFLILSYFFNAQFFAMVGLTIGLMRTTTFFLYEKKGDRASIKWSFLFSALTLASYCIINLGILKDAKPLDILCLASLSMYAFIFRIRNLKTVRFLMIIPTVLSILFNILTFAPIFATLSYSFELGANVVSIFKYHVLPQKKEEKTLETKDV